jgi:hypothetical protein
MPKSRWTWTAVVAVGFVAAALLFLASQPPLPPEQALDPSLEVLVREAARGDRNHRSPFFAALLSLARKHAASGTDYLPDHSVEEGFAVKVGDGHVVAVLRGASRVIPGTDTQYLLLLDREGRLLDRLSCDINNRLTRMFEGSGIFRTDVSGRPGHDGAYLVVRYIPESGDSISGNWSHEIVHQGKTYSFLWDQDRPNAIRSVEWERKGLCRVGIQGGKFVVLFPCLVEPASGH